MSNSIIKSKMYNFHTGIWVIYVIETLKHAFKPYIYMFGLKVYVLTCACDLSWFCVEKSLINSY